MDSLLKVALIMITLAYKLSFIPDSFLSPAKCIKSSAVYDQENDEIITIGGDYGSSDHVPQIYIYNLKSKKFKKINPQSHTKPTQLSGHYIYLNNNQKIFTFGPTSEIFSFCLKSYTWKLESLNKGIFVSRKDFASINFIFEGVNYIGIYGGLSDQGYLLDLIL